MQMPSAPQQFLLCCESWCTCLHRSDEGGLLAFLQEHCVCHDMASPTDYRKLAHPRLGMYFTGKGRWLWLHDAVSALLPHRA
jgi:hypothetical protein